MWLLILVQAFASVPPNSISLDLSTQSIRQQLQSAKQKGPSYYKELLKLAGRPSASQSERWRALTLAAQLNKKSLPEVRKFLKAKEWYMRNAALLALASVDKNEGRIAAIDLLSDRALVVRSAAVEVLAQESLTPLVRNRFWKEFSASYNFRKKQGLWVREQILAKLSEEPQAIEQGRFLAILESKDQHLHSHAIASLERIHNTVLGRNSQDKRAAWLARPGQPTKQ